MASDLKTQLQAIYDERQQLTPDIVVEVASDPEHPLHDRFEWDDEVAGDAYRRVQASRLIRSVKIRYLDREGAPQAARAFVSVRTLPKPDEDLDLDDDDEDAAPAGSYRYLPLEVVTQDEAMTRQLMQQARRDWAAYKKRYKSLLAFWEMIRAELEAHDNQAA